MVPTHFYFTLLYYLLTSLLKGKSKVFLYFNDKKLALFIKTNGEQGFSRKAQRNRPLERPRRRWEMRSELILGILAGWVWIGFDWLRIGTSGELFVSAVIKLRVLAPRS
jgi:hypothetical protein